MTRNRKYRKEHHEEHADESWLIPYADILTLLLALFIVLYASSQVDQKKFERLAYSMNQAFNGSPSIFDKNQSMLEQSTVKEESTRKSVDKQLQLNESSQLSEVRKELEHYIAANNLADDFTTSITEDGLLIRIKDSAFFPSGSAKILPKHNEFSKELSKMLASLPQKVIVSGHTDTIPISNAEFPSNWHLSTTRALNFMLHLLQNNNTLDPVRFSALGYGEYRPIATNETSEGRAQNRRVEILIARSQH